MLELGSLSYDEDERNKYYWRKGVRGIGQRLEDEEEDWDTTLPRNLRARLSKKKGIYDGQIDIQGKNLLHPLVKAYRDGDIKNFFLKPWSQEREAHLMFSERANDLLRAALKQRKRKII